MRWVISGGGPDGYGGFAPPRRIAGGGAAARIGRNHGRRPIAVGFRCYSARSVKRRRLPARWAATPSLSLHAALRFSAQASRRGRAPVPDDRKPQAPEPLAGSRWIGAEESARNHPLRGAGWKTGAVIGPRSSRFPGRRPGNTQWCRAHQTWTAPGTAESAFSIRFWRIRSAASRSAGKRQVRLSGGWSRRTSMATPSPPARDSKRAAASLAARRRRGLPDVAQRGPGPAVPPRPSSPTEPFEPLGLVGG